VSLCPLDEPEPVRAVCLVRPMRGSAQSVLVECTDGAQYVVKSFNNPQGPHVLFNEALGTELMRAFGLPVAPWKPVLLTSSLLASNPEFDLETSRGRMPRVPGLHFGSLYMVPENSIAHEIIPSGWLKRVVGREHFLRALVLDLWVCNRDQRQALFLPMTPGPGAPLQPVFFDNGHMFGGPEWGFRDQITKSLYGDLSVYADLLRESAIQRAVNEVLSISVSDVIQSLSSIPHEWLPAQDRCFEMLGLLFGRQRQLPALVDEAVGFLEAKLAKMHGYQSSKSPSHLLPWEPVPRAQ
jgi:hypothetical protein